MSVNLQVIGPHLAFAAIWAVFAAVFFVLARHAYLARKVAFPQFKYRIPGNIHMHISGVKFEQVINDFADRFDAHISHLNSSARTTTLAALLANGVSCGLAIFGFLAEVCSWGSL